MLEITGCILLGLIYETIINVENYFLNIAVSFDGSESLQEEETYIQVRNQTDELLKLLKDCGNDQRALEKLPTSTRNYLKTWVMSGELERKSVHSSHSEVRVEFYTMFMYDIHENNIFVRLTLTARLVQIPRGF